MVKHHINQNQAANMFFAAALICTLTFKILFNIVLFLVFTIILVALLSNRRGIEMAGMAAGIGSLSFLILFFDDGYSKTAAVMIYCLIIFGSTLHIMNKIQEEGE